jgi:hypothetical protein
LCGYAQSEIQEVPLDQRRGTLNLPKDFENHLSLYSSRDKRPCWKRGDTYSPLRTRVLAARDTTDMLIIYWPQSLSVEIIRTIGQALRLGGARILEVDTRELEMLLVPGQDRGINVVIFDSTPGGSGHCYELFKIEKPWMISLWKF